MYTAFIHKYTKYLQQAFSLYDILIILLITINKLSNIGDSILIQ